MAACKNDVLLNKIFSSKLSERTEVDLDIHRDLDDCRKLDAKKAIAVSGTSSYSKYIVPGNQFECMREGCVNSGTLTFTAGTAETALYKLPWDATDFASGVITFYVKASTYPASVTVKISDTQALTNADVYTVSVTSAMTGADGFAPVVVDLSQTPDSTDGGGWTASANGAYLSIGGTSISISSIAVFDSIADFAVNEVVKVACLSSLGSDLSWSTLEATCTQNGYDTSADPSFDISITGKLITPNYFAANPMLVHGKATTGFDMVTEEYTIESGVVTLIHVAPEECGFISAQLAEDCSSDSMLQRLSIPVPVTLDEDHFQVIRNADGTATVRFNSGLNGLKVLVSYPKTATVEEQVTDINALDRFHARLSYPMVMSDGTKYRLVFDDVLITGFPMTLSNSDQDVTFTARIQKAKFKKYRIIE